MGELIVSGIKTALVVSAGLAMMAAILAIIGSVGSLVSSTIVGEIFEVISLSLPFDIGVVFGSFAVSMSAILSFMIAHKIWSMTIITTDAS